MTKRKKKVLGESRKGEKSSGHMLMLSFRARAADELGTGMDTMKQKLPLKVKILCSYTHTHFDKYFQGFNFSTNFYKYFTS